MQKAEFPNFMHNFEAFKHIYDTVLHYFCTEIIGGAFRTVCSTNHLHHLDQTTIETLPVQCQL